MKTLTPKQLLQKLPIVLAQCLQCLQWHHLLGDDKWQINI